MDTQILLVTPPFSQLNTPYPATAYLKGFLNTKDISSFQMDLGLETILALYSKKGLERMFLAAEENRQKFSTNSERIFMQKEYYIYTIEAVIQFLQSKNPTLANRICQEQYLPEAGRFQHLEELDWAFGTMGIQDKAKHLATLYLEDLSDFIVENLDPEFGFSRYAERIGRSANSFLTIQNALNQPLSFIDSIYIEILEKKIEAINPKVIAFTIPFPGNLFSSFRCAQWVKSKYPSILTTFGGGFANTELRSLSEPKVFEYFDFITLDKGEAPLECLIEYSQNKKDIKALKRTYCLIEHVVTYIDNPEVKDYKAQELGTPDYSDLALDQYISVIELANPMHRLWSDGRWNKLTMAHGCYWGKCTFCDISLDYIKSYQPQTAQFLCDQMETLIEKTGETGFHFVDEAAPPALLRDLALEILRRKLNVSWWTNIRFERNFTKDLCLLLKESGCIAVSGGLEVASDRLLSLIEKGVSVAQVAQVCHNFTEAGIMVHSYLMYGYPTQTMQETVDSLEMVRQMFELGVLQSGFWHQFALTAHSPVGLHPEKYGIEIVPPVGGGFALNDLYYTEKNGIDHEIFSFGLKKSLFNFMQGVGYEQSLQSWFDFKIPRTSIPKNYIETALQRYELEFSIKASAKIVWIGPTPKIERVSKRKKGLSTELITLSFFSKRETLDITLIPELAEFVLFVLDKVSLKHMKLTSFQEIKADFNAKELGDFELFWFNKPFNKLRTIGLLVF